jgi:hypothetical protein
VVLTNIAYARVGKLLMMCTSATDPTDAEIDTWIQRLATRDYEVLLFSARSGGPNSKQRARIAEYWRKSGRKVPRAALVTASAPARFIMQAISLLLNVEGKSFAPEELETALGYLGMPAPLADVSGSLAALHAAIEFKQRRTG